MNYRYFSQPAYQGCLDVVRISQIGEDTVLEENFYTNGSTTRITKQSFTLTLEEYIDRSKENGFFDFKEIEKEYFLSVREKVKQIIQSTFKD